MRDATLPMYEKKINRYLNMYLRLPGILFNCYAGFVNYLYQNQPFCNIGLGSLIFLLNMWNATYFAHRVVENYGYSAGKRDMLIKSKITQDNLEI